jgi:hypothetical protein
VTERLKGCVLPFVVAVGDCRGARPRPFARCFAGASSSALRVTELNTSSIVGGCSSASTITRDSTTAFIHHPAFHAIGASDAVMKTRTPRRIGRLSESLFPCNHLGHRWHPHQV